MALPDFQVVQQDEGSVPPIRHFQVLTGSTFINGQCVKIDIGTGHIEVAVDSGTNFLGVALDSAVDCLADGRTCPVRATGFLLCWQSSKL